MFFSAYSGDGPQGKGTEGAFLPDASIPIPKKRENIFCFPVEVRRFRLYVIKIEFLPAARASAIFKKEKRPVSGEGD